MVPVSPDLLCLSNRFQKYCQNLHTLAKGCREEWDEWAASSRRWPETVTIFLPCQLSRLCHEPPFTVKSKDDVQRMRQYTSRRFWAVVDKIPEDASTGVGNTPHSSDDTGASPFWYKRCRWHDAKESDREVYVLVPYCRFEGPYKTCPPPGFCNEPRVFRAIKKDDEEDAEEDAKEDAEEDAEEMLREGPRKRTRGPMVKEKKKKKKKKKKKGKENEHAWRGDGPYVVLAFTRPNRPPCPGLIGPGPLTDGSENLQEAGGPAVGIKGGTEILPQGSTGILQDSRLLHDSTHAASPAPACFCSSEGLDLPTSMGCSWNQINICGEGIDLYSGDGLVPSASTVSDMSECMSEDMMLDDRGLALREHSSTFCTASQDLTWDLMEPVLYGRTGGTDMAHESSPRHSEQLVTSTVGAAYDMMRNNFAAPSTLGLCTYSSPQGAIPPRLVHLPSAPAEEQGWLLTRAMYSLKIRSSEDMKMWDLDALRAWRGPNSYSLLHVIMSVDLQHLESTAYDGTRRECVGPQLRQRMSEEYWVRLDHARHVVVSCLVSGDQHQAVLAMENDRGSTALHTAAWTSPEGWTKVLEHLVSLCDDLHSFLKKTHRSGSCAWTVALGFGNFEAAQVLLDHLKFLLIRDYGDRYLEVWQQYVYCLQFTSYAQCHNQLLRRYWRMNEEWMPEPADHGLLAM